MRRPHAGSRRDTSAGQSRITSSRGNSPAPGIGAGHRPHNAHEAANAQANVFIQKSGDRLGQQCQCRWEIRGPEPIRHFETAKMETWASVIGKGGDAGIDGTKFNFSRGKKPELSCPSSGCGVSLWLDWQAAGLYLTRRPVRETQDHTPSSCCQTLPAVPEKNRRGAQGKVLQAEVAHRRGQQRLHCLQHPMEIIEIENRTGTKANTYEKF